ncbi:MAG: hypothetical protein AAFZ11_07415 [Pseudomonadota bacterium]
MKTRQTPTHALCLALALPGALVLAACGDTPVSGPTNTSLRSAIEAKDFAAARAQLAEIFENGDADAKTQRLKLELMLDLEDGYAAMAAIDALPDSALGADERRVARAHALILQDKAEAAAALYAGQDRAGFGEPDYHMMLWAMRELEDEEGFVTGMDQALEAYPQSADINALAARVLFDADLAQEAAPFADQAITTDPAHYEARVVQGELAIAREDLNAALAHYEAARDAYPSRALPYANIAGLQLDLERAEAAGETLRTAIAMHPEDPFLQWQLARFALVTGDLEIARKAIEAARRTYRGNDEFTLLSAQAEERFGNPSLAVSEYRRYLRAVGEDEAVEARIAALEAGL